MSYTPIRIDQFQEGLNQRNEEFKIPDDAFSDLLNVYTWRGRVKRRRGNRLLGRLRRILTTFTYSTTGVTPWSFNLLMKSGGIAAIDISGAPTLVVTATNHGLTNGDTVIFTGVGGTTQLNGNTYTIANKTDDTFEVTQAAPGAFTSGGFWFSNRSLSATEPDADIQCGSLVITLDPAGTPNVLTDQGDGTLTASVVTAPVTSGTINYATGAVVIIHTLGAGAAVNVAYNYYPSLPVMGCRTRELTAINDEESVFFDAVYAYEYNSGIQGFQELNSSLAYTWSGSNSNFFWTTNYWQDANNNDLFWATNASGATGDPMRYYNGITWTDFEPAVDGTNFLEQALILIPFRGLLLALNTREGTTLAASESYPQRVRGSQIGTPLAADAWRDDTPGKGFYFDLPTNEAIQAVGFVRDNLVVFCERSSWLLSWTGDSLVPVIDQRENTDLGVESTFSVINFDDHIIGVGDKFIVGSDSINASVVNDKIPEFAFQIHNENEGHTRVQGVRNYNDRLAYWTYPDFRENGTYPNRMLIYNYEEKSWSFFRDNITCFGTFQSFTDEIWANVTWTWAEWTTTWNDGVIQSQFPDICGGNQHGFIMLMNKQQADDASMSIKAVTITNSQVVLTIPDHNLEEGEFIKLVGFIEDYADLNGIIYQIDVVTDDTISLFEYVNENFIPKNHAGGTYLGCGRAEMVMNFRMLSKKFNFIEQGKKILIGYVDLLLNQSDDAKFNINFYQDYRDSESMVRNPFWSQQVEPKTNEIDTPGQTKVFKKFYVGSAGNFVQYEITTSAANMVSQPTGMTFQLDSIVLYVRPTGRLSD